MLSAGQNWIPMLELGHEDQSAIDRVAISRALIDCGYLVVRRRMGKKEVDTSDAGYESFNMKN